MKKTNLQYHLLKLVPQLFIASLHYRDINRQNATTDMTAECGSRKQKLLYDNHFNQMIGQSLAKVDRLEYQIEDLEEGKGYMLEATASRGIGGGDLSGYQEGEQ